MKEYFIKGFVMDDECLKNLFVGDFVVLDYFDEMLECICDICVSECCVYLWVKEIFIMVVDYELFN